MYTTSEDELSFGDKAFKEAFTVGERTFYGGSEGRVTDRFWDGVVSLNERNKNTVVEMYIPKFSATTRIFNVQCYNFAAPAMDLEGWQNLIKDLPTGDIAVCCYGGIGRTGTALAILRSLLMGDKETDPIAVIRDSYRKRAVESESQLAYIEKMTGAKSNIELFDSQYNYLYDPDFWHNY